MEIIVRPQENIEKIWKKPQLRNLEYRLITYSVRSGDYLCNTITGEVVHLSEDESMILDSLPALYCEEMKELILSHFLVPIEFDEKNLVDRLRLINKAANKGHYFDRYTILPTTGCNAHCFYCYESECEHVTMTTETADKVASFIVDHCQQKPVHISWFGGEPLIGIDRINQICTRLQTSGIEYSSKMTSNGLLFTDDVIQVAKELWRLKRVQITLDGTEKIYNQVKAYSNVQGSPFQKVLDNIDKLIKADIRVSVRLNMDKHNVDDLFELIDQLSVRFNECDNLSVYVAMLYKDKGFSPINHKEEEYLHLLEKQKLMHQLLKEKGLHRNEKRIPHLRFTKCQADNSHSILINPKGELGKCEHFLFDKMVGDIENGITDLQTEAWWKEPMYSEICSSCPFYPGCVNLKHCESAKSCTPWEIEQGIEDTKAWINQIVLNCL